MSPSLSRAFSIEDLARLARKRLPRAVFDFYEGGAEGEHTLRRNAAAFAEAELVPQVMRDVSRIDTSCTLLGGAAAMPMAIAPMGAVGFGRRGGDIAIARAAADAGVPYILSTTATASIEKLASSAGGRLWFQSYALKQRDAGMRLIDRAREAGYEALVVTADVPVGGKRERDLHNDFAMPFRFTLRNTLDFASRPRWAFDMMRHGIPVLENLADIDAPSATAGSATSSVGREFDPAFGWEDLRVLRDRWPGKLILKGVARASDALRARELGCDGVVVSNHGGRQLDGSSASLTALPAIVAAVQGQMEVLVDGGVRRGSDIVKALALGANGVLIGRPVLYGVCAAGEPGVAHALAILRDELVRTMRLCGTPGIKDIGRELMRD